MLINSITVRVNKHVNKQYNSQVNKHVNKQYNSQFNKHVPTKVLKGKLDLP